MIGIGAYTSSKHKLVVAAALLCLTAGQAKAEEVTLTWDAPTTAGVAPNVTTFTAAQIAQIKYNVYYGTETGKYGPVVAVPTAGATSFKITGLTAGTKYFFSADATLAPYGTSSKAIEVNYTIPYPQINAPATLKLTFVPVSTPLSMQITPTTIGQTAAGLVPITRNIVAVNNSTVPVKVNTAFIVPPTSPFKLNTAFPVTIAAAGRAYVSVTFTPTKAGYYYANAVLDTDAGYLVEPLSAIGVQ